MIAKQYRYPVVLCIAGSDSGGGAGIQADVKTISALGCYATTAITAVTVQNTQGVKDIHSIPINTVIGQIDAVMEDIRPDAIKIGMLDRKDLIAAIADKLKAYPNIPLVLDPVMVATSGDRLTSDNTVDVLKERLCPLSMIITPNLNEAAIFFGKRINDLPTMKIACADLLKHGAASVLIKGGHLEGEELFNVFHTANGEQRMFSSTRINTNNTHGTGCSLSSAIAAFLALGHPLHEAVSNAATYIHEAISAGADVRTGTGNGPINHFHQPEKLKKYVLDTEK
ncbi:bifunctional hydroxymethylpyrimidine kinase/phosphomethylpyrimidine kinase [Olivibacter sitiensis]|uniref:bifunctional hydroxymethylpyrimidine kinase/phosphomethylpyrimidine kinase n=1 Tax=Olivibacter sitiensis TaxID=376470 RepID=UPI0004043DEC|nr:bifunctional hydroxymethylpyrimidine kinase/phosphomethylpyrimidine kinase [Olivibacter sitiensis]